MDFKNMSRDTDWTVRQRVARNPSSPLLIIQKLALDKRPEVAFAAVQNKICPTALLIDFLTGENTSYSWFSVPPSRKMVRRIAKMKHCPAEALDIIAARHSAEGLKYWVAVHPNTMGETLYAMFQNTPNLRHIIFQHPNFNESYKTEAILTDLI